MVKFEVNRIKNTQDITNLTKFCIFFTVKIFLFKGDNLLA